MARVVSASGTERRELSDAWELTMARTDGDWIPAAVPGTVASALRARGEWNEEDPRDFDEADVWYRTSFDAVPDDDGTSPATPERDRNQTTQVLTFGGLGPLAEVSLNGEVILTSDNMFHQHAVDVSGRLREKNDLLLRFRALGTELKAKRPRPRWRSRLTKHTHLRWIRVPLAGRIPDWCQNGPAVGPWRPIALERRTGPAVVSADARTHLDGTTGVCDVRIVLRGAVSRASLNVGAVSGPLECQRDGEETVVRGSLRIADVARWWPHTHGISALHALSVDCDGQTIDLGQVGFRTIERTGGEDGFGLRINGVDVFCRGTVWSLADLATLDGTPESYRYLLGLVKQAGMNMVRVVGLMAYESDTFFDVCDELGILVFHEFMFGSMDYPADDAAFSASVEREAEEFLSRVQTRPSLAVLCGNSENEQLAAMLGLPREAWKSPLFHRLLPSVCARLRPDVPYLPSSPSGGSLPMHVKSGLSHYYGVGAYLRPLSDARLAGVRFASEALAFANVPEDESIERWLEGHMPHHDPKWKAGVARNSGLGWDFEDVRDHYLQLLFKLEPLALRYSDPARYMALSRIVPGEVMSHTFGEFRRRASTCQGALVWLFKDFRPGAGFGLVDSSGLPKAPYYYAKRVLAPVSLVISDEGLNGLELHAFNDGDSPVMAEVRLTLIRHGNVTVATGSRAVTIEPHSAVEIQGDELFEHFLDTTFAWRFGPPAHEVTVATLVAGDTVLAEAFHFPSGLSALREPSVGLSATAVPSEGGNYALTVRTERFAQSVAIRAPQFLPDDNYFHLAPGTGRTVTLAPRDRARPPRSLSGTVEAANAYATARISQ
jgi:beta-mannosidase